MELLQLKPKASKFKLNNISDDVEFILRPITLSDEVWLKENFEDVSKVFENLDMLSISKIVFHQLAPESRNFFKARDIVLIDDEGIEQHTKLGGVKLLQEMITGYDNKIAVIMALLECVGFSRPEIDEKTDEVAEGEQKAEKKN